MTGNFSAPPSYNMSVNFLIFFDRDNVVLLSATDSIFIFYVSNICNLLLYRVISLTLPTPGGSVLFFCQQQTIFCIFISAIFVTVCFIIISLTLPTPGVSVFCSGPVNECQNSFIKK